MRIASAIMRLERLLSQTSITLDSLMAVLGIRDVCFNPLKPALAEKSVASSLSKLGLHSRPTGAELAELLLQLPERGLIRLTPQRIACLALLGRI